MLSATRVSFALGAVLLLSACGKLDPKECNLVRKKAFDVLSDGAKCKTDADCGVTTWPGAPREANQDQLTRIKPIKDEFDKGKCEEPKQEAAKAPEVFCNNSTYGDYVCTKRVESIRTEKNNQ